MTKEEILHSSHIDKKAWQHKYIIEAMQQYADQEVTSEALKSVENAIAFAQYCSSKNIYPNDYSYKQFKTENQL